MGFNNPPYLRAHALAFGLAYCVRFGEASRGKRLSLLDRSGLEGGDTLLKRFQPGPKNDAHLISLLTIDLLPAVASVPAACATREPERGCQPFAGLEAPRFR